ncbi:hypothetical protein HanXRQr2_Chr12g0525441 [Helianthus annuus]|uniref:Uncharacterized protein n=1 Tax=Helianthus annuus TaxID=4232 RepID=A0A251SYW9_HELAN|nr:hypothetical protein HanXRQr2_Chr12g0525441 [Helianthus annuus]KAJ0861402.1 hypothetical protein HanPSC8_Chr12g0506221 [Helianthus annuus]
MPLGTSLNLDLVVAAVADDVVLELVGAVLRLPGHDLDKPAMEIGAPREVAVAVASLIRLNPPEGPARPLQQHLADDRLDRTAPVGPTVAIRDLSGYL